MVDCPTDTSSHDYVFFFSFMSPVLVEVLCATQLMRQVHERMNQRCSSSTMMATYGMTCKEAKALGIGQLYSFHGIADQNVSEVKFIPTLTHAKVIIDPVSNWLYLGSANAHSSSRDTGMCAFLSDKALDPVIKNIIRKFPTVDTKSSNVSIFQLDIE